jgi:hypothetical protein
MVDYGFMTQARIPSLRANIGNPAPQICVFLRFDSSVRVVQVSGKIIFKAVRKSDSRSKKGDPKRVALIFSTRLNPRET